MNLELGINEGISNTEYHSDRNFLSSSVLKTIYKDIAEYKKYYIDGEVKPQPANTAALEEGTLAHSMILEPHLVDTDYLFFKGAIKTGPEWKAFKEALPKNVMGLSWPQKARVEELAKVYRSRPEAVQLVEGCITEHTICAELSGVPVKIRADGIRPGEGIILDVKTTGYGSDKESFIMTLKKLDYQLSAALYCQVAEQFYGRPFKFYFIVLSKRDKTCDVYKASQDTRHEGDQMVATALRKYKKAKETGIWAEGSSDSTCSSGTYQVEEV